MTDHEKVLRNHWALTPTMRPELRDALLAGADALADVAKARIVMDCGHPQAWINSSEEGTHFCVGCAWQAEVAARKEAEAAVEYGRDAIRVAVECENAERALADALAEALTLLARDMEDERPGFPDWREIATTNADGPRGVMIVQSALAAHVAARRTP